jgi:ribosome-associated protein
MDSKKLALLCRELAENKKGENIVVLDVHEVSSITDYFVIVSGTSEPHLRAISDEILSKLRDDHELRPRAVDGSLQTAWLVLDYFDVIVHVMKVDVRERYDLEGLWGDAPKVKPKKKTARKKTEQLKPLSAFSRTETQPDLPRYSCGGGGASDDACTIWSMIFLKSSSPGAGMMMVSRRPLTSSVMRKNRPRGFSLSAKTKVFRSI